MEMKFTPCRWPGLDSAPGLELPVITDSFEKCKPARMARGRKSKLIRAVGVGNDQGKGFDLNLVLDRLQPPLIRYPAAPFRKRNSPETGTGLCFNPDTRQTAPPRWTS